jgi:Flp pilus assembly protein TadB
MIRSRRSKALDCINDLQSSPKASASQLKPELGKEIENKASASNDKLTRLIHFSGTKLTYWQVVLSSILAGLLAFIACFSFLPTWIAFFGLFAAASFPISFLDKQAQRRALEFSKDFPSVLLATASSLSAGHTALVAIERSTKLMPKENKVRCEVQVLLESLRVGKSREIVLSQFASDIRLPELELFRSAFLLSLENGGKLSPTLDRLSQVLKDRSILVKSARTATSVMRMTSTVLLTLTPLILGGIAFRTPQFLTLLTVHPVANQVGSLGALLIFTCCWILRRMSDFRP